MTAAEAARQAEAALDAIHAALLEGRLDALDPLAAGIAGALSRIDGLSDMALALRLREKAARNEHCLAAALRGVRAAARRVGDLAAAARGMQTYDGRGRRAVLAPGDGRLARRI